MVVFMGKSSIDGWFSMAMLNNQMVSDMEGLKYSGYMWKYHLYNDICTDIYGYMHWYMWIGYMDYPLFVGYFIIYTLSLDISIICVNYPHSISINDGEDVDNDDWSWDRPQVGFSPSVDVLRCDPLGSGRLLRTLRMIETHFSKGKSTMTAEYLKLCIYIYMYIYIYIWMYAYEYT